MAKFRKRTKITKRAKFANRTNIAKIPKFVKKKQNLPLKLTCEYFSFADNSPRNKFCRVLQIATKSGEDELVPSLLEV